MENKIIPKKYMLVLGYEYGNQTAIELYSDDEFYASEIKKNTDEKIKYTHKKYQKVVKNTLAFYDAITCKFEDFPSFLKIIRNVETFRGPRYKRSYVGFINEGYMNKLKLAFNNSELAQIAVAADGNYINMNDEITINAFRRIINRIEDNTSDFVETLRDFHYGGSEDYDFTNSLVEYICYFKYTKRKFDHSCKYSHYISDAKSLELSDAKEKVLKELKRYKNFREIIRFEKEYLLKKNNQTTKEKPNISTEKPKVKEKTYSETSEIPGQMTFF